MIPWEVPDDKTLVPGRQVCRLPGKLLISTQVGVTGQGGLVSQVVTVMTGTGLMRI